MRKQNDQFIEVTLVVDGAVEQEETLESLHDYRDFIANAEREWEGSDTPAMVYALFHDHAQDGEECQCIQYETDHSPVWENRAAERVQF